MGWLVRAFRSVADHRGEMVASWETHTRGLMWLNPLIESGQVSYQNGHGYPDRYLIPADLLMAEIEKAKSNAASDKRTRPPYRFAGFKWGPGERSIALSETLILQAWDST